MFGIGMTELLVILVVALIVFGPTKLPELARSLGKAMNEFRRASNDLRASFNEAVEPPAPRPPVPPAIAAPTPPEKPAPLDQPPTAPAAGAPPAEPTPAAPKAAEAQPPAAPKPDTDPAHG